MFTPYYILAVGFGVLATIVSLIGLKKAGDENFPGKLATPIMLAGALIGIGTFVFVWRGGEEELDHKKHEQEHQIQEEQNQEGAALPAGITRSV
jgi:hypothetical protein